MKKRALVKKSMVLLLVAAMMLSTLQSHTISALAEEPAEEISEGDGAAEEIIEGDGEAEEAVSPAEPERTETILPDSAETGAETETGAEAETEIEAEDEIGPVQESGGTDPDTLFEEYLEHALYPEEQPAGPVLRKKAARAIALAERAQVLRELVRPSIASTADGYEASAIFELNLPEPVAYDITELGVEAIVKDGAVTEEAKSALKSLFMADMKPAMSALQAEQPYIFYWFDKTVGWSSSYSMSATSQRIRVTKVKLKMSVAAAYSVSGTERTYDVDTSKTSAARETVAYAQEVVAEADIACDTDYEFIVHYTEWLCKETDYNYAAAGNSATPYGDPWQLIYAFDKDPETKIVCEGYAKAFKYLCDLTSFNDPDVDVMLMSGDMSSNRDVTPRSGGHMWNNVRMDDGRYYLVDVTNCDLGKNGLGEDIWTLDLCLKGYGEAVTNTYGYAGYSFGREASTLYYYYYDDTRNLFTEEELAVSAMDYGQYLVTFDAGKGTAAFTQKIVVFDAAYGELPGAERTGYGLAGWFTAQTGGTEVTAETIVERAEDHTLYARWAPVATVQTPVLRLLDGGAGTVINHSTATPGEAAEVPMGARLRMTSATPDAHIYYRMYADSAEAYADADKFDDFLVPYPADGEVETECFRYTEEIILTPEMPGMPEPDGDGYRNLTIWAIAVKHEHTNSGYAATTIRIYDEDTKREGAQDWGDVVAEDRAAYGNPSALPKGIWIAGVTDRTYTGAKQTFANLRVYHNKKLLKPKRDYTVAYKNNIKAADASGTKPPTVTVTGRGSYSGTYTKTFSILPLDLSDANDKVTTTADALFAETGAHIILAWNGKVQKKKLPLTVTDPVTGKTLTLKENKDYTLTWKQTTPDAFKAPGKWSVTVAGTGSCTGEREWILEILNTDPAKTGIGTEADARIHVNSLRIPAIPAQTFVYAVNDANVRTGAGKAFVYAPEGSAEAGSFDAKTQAKLLNADGTEFQWSITDKNNHSLVFETDYDLMDYRYHAAVGTAKVTVVGKGKYAGMKTVSFKINGRKLDRATVSFPSYTAKGFPYTGRPYEFAGPARKDGEDEPADGGEIKLTDSSGAGELERGIDYTVSYSRNTEPGTAVILFTGIGAYSGTIKKTFRIVAHGISAEEDLLVEWKENGSAREWKADGTDAPRVPYDKGGAKPEPVLTYSYTYEEGGVTKEYKRVLQQGDDFTLRWKNNTAVWEAGAKNPPTLIIKGKGSFSGSITRTFTIVPKDMKDCGVTAADVVYSGKAGKFKSAPKVTDRNGSVLKAGTDYDKMKTAYYYMSLTELADGTLREEGEPVRAEDIVPAGTVLRVTVTGKGRYTGTASGVYRVVSGDLSKAKVRIDPQYYTGNEIRLTKRQISVTLGGVQLADNDYEIVSYKNNLNKGKAYVTLRGRGNYGKEKTAAFSIVLRPFGVAVRFDGNRATSGSMKRLSAAPGETVTLTKNTFKRTHYSFKGWNTKADGTGASFADRAKNFTVPDDAVRGTVLTLYAQWEPVEYRVTWYTQGGSNHPDNEKLTSYHAEDKVFVIRNPLREDWPEGMWFAGWYTGADYKTRITRINPAKGGDLQLYAKWVPESWQIQYEMNGGVFPQGAPDLIESMQQSGAKAFRLPVPQKEGSTFAGWYSDSIFKKRVTEVIPGTGDGVTVYAKWKASDQKDIANAQITIVKQKYTGSPVLLKKSDVFVRFGDTLLDDASFEILEDSYLYNVEDTVNIERGKIVQRARVTIRGLGKYKGTKMVYFDIDQNAVTYRVTYDNNRAYLASVHPGVAEESMFRGVMPAGETLAGGARLTANKYSATWFTFSGWNTKADGSGIAYEDKETLCNKEGKPLAETDGTAVTLYAQWEKAFVYNELTNLPMSPALADQRPIAVMIDNEKVALPHYGMSEADVVYEMINSTANNRVTRYMALYKDWRNIPRIGNVRSTRPTNALLFPEWGAVLFHEGAPYVHTNPYFNNDYTPHIDGGFSRISNGKAYEFTSYVTKGQPAARMAAAGISANYTEPPRHGQVREHYRFAPYGQGLNPAVDYQGVINAKTVDLSGVFPKNDPVLQYDEGKGVYRYSEYGAVHKDAEDNAALEFKNVILQNASISVLDTNGYLIYNVLHAGIGDDNYKEGWYLTNGKAVPVRWHKGAATEYTRYFAKNSGGHWVEITVASGKTYIGLIPADTWSGLRIQ